MENIFGTTISSEGLITLIAVIIFIAIIVMVEASDSKKEEKEALEDEELESAMSYYGLSESKYVSTKNEKFKVLIEKASRKEKGWRDKLYYSTSWPHKISNYELSVAAKCIPETVSVRVENNHQILVEKSPAADFEDINHHFLLLLFENLHDCYLPDQKHKTITVNEAKFNQCLIVFNLEIMPVGYPKLITSIDELEFVSYVGVSDSDPSSMSVEIDNDVSLDQVKPQIIKVFENFFTAGVSFRGDWVTE